VRVEYLLEGTTELRPLYENRGINKFFEGDGEWRESVDVNAEIDETPEPTAAEQQAAVRRTEDQVCLRRLLGHLNAQQHHYNQVIWLNQNPTARAAALDEHDYLGGTLLDYVTNRPLAVLGNYVAYPLRDPIADDRAFVPPAPVERVVSLSARGVFAEAQLSSCNVCEKRDIIRAKDWSTSPCKDSTAPPITGVSPGSRARDPDLTPTPMPDSVVNIVNPQPIPDPTGMASAMGLLGSADIFRDMSGDARNSRDCSGSSPRVRSTCRKPRKRRDRYSHREAGAAVAPPRPTPESSRATRCETPIPSALMISCKTPRSCTTAAGSARRAGVRQTAISSGIRPVRILSSRAISSPNL